jgi:hypothetical protein
VRRGHVHKRVRRRESGNRERRQYHYCCRDKKFLHCLFYPLLSFCLSPCRSGTCDFWGEVSGLKKSPRFLPRRLVPPPSAVRARSPVNPFSLDGCRGSLLSAPSGSRNGTMSNAAFIRAVYYGSENRLPETGIPDVPRRLRHLLA